MITVKKCTKCHEWKDESEFCKHKRNKDGLDWQCRQCKSGHYYANRDSIYAQRQKFHEEHPEKRPANQKRYRDANPERERTRHQQYYIADKDRINTRNRSWRINNPDKESERHRRWLANNPEKRRLWEEANIDRIRAWQHLRWERRKDDYNAFRRAHPELTYPAVYERRGQLGFTPLNSKFIGSEFHHLIILRNGTLDNNVGIFIPRELHTRVKHNRKTLQGFDKINDLAISWVIGEGYRRALQLMDEIGWPNDRTDTARLPQDI